MKIEIGESVCYSFLRHVKRCWLVQANWKASENWPKRKTDGELERIFTQMKESFDADGRVFKGTKDFGQFLKQGEIDVVGVELDGSVHAMEVAYHEAGLNYTGGAANRVLRKLLRTMLILDAYHPESIEKHIYFVSPKVYRGAQRPLEDTFKQLRTAYPIINWQLITNEEFGSHLLSPTLQKSAAVADTSELFVRSAKLLELGGLTEKGSDSHTPFQTEADRQNSDIRAKSSKGQPGQIQPLIRFLMKTTLEDFPGLLSQRDLCNLMVADYCKHSLGLELGNHALLRRFEDGRAISGHNRYYAKVYGGRYYVTNNWWPKHHCHNARSIIQFVGELIDSHPDHNGISELRKYRMALRDYLRRVKI